MFPMGCEMLKVERQIEAEAPIWCRRSGAGRTHATAPRLAVSGMARIGSSIPRRMAEPDRSIVLFFIRSNQCLETLVD
jgi:hypothetical protein